MSYGLIDYINNQPQSNSDQAGVGLQQFVSQMNQNNQPQPYMLAARNAVKNVPALINSTTVKVAFLTQSPPFFINRTRAMQGMYLSTLNPPTVKIAFLAQLVGERDLTHQSQSLFAHKDAI